jgi:hypothetical protein
LFSSEVRTPGRLGVYWCPLLLFDVQGLAVQLPHNSAALTLVRRVEWEPEGTRRRGRPKERWID